MFCHTRLFCPFVQECVSAPLAARGSPPVYGVWPPLLAYRSAATTGQTRRAPQPRPSPDAPRAGYRPAGRSRRARTPARSPAPSGRSPAPRQSSAATVSHGNPSSALSIGSAWAKVRSLSSAMSRSCQVQVAGQADLPVLLELSGLGRHTQDCFQPADPLVPVGRLDIGGQRPEPQRAPGVHHSAQPPVGAVLVVQHRLDLLAGHRGARPAHRSSDPTRRCRGGSPTRRWSAGAASDPHSVSTRCGQCGQSLLDRRARVAANAVAPQPAVLRACPGRRSWPRRCRSTAPQPSAGSRKWWMPAPISSPERDVAWARSFSHAFLASSVGRVHRAAGADQRVAAAQVQPEPRRLQARRPWCPARARSRPARRRWR